VNQGVAWASLAILVVEMYRWRREGDGVLEVLKASCEVGTGRNQGPSDVAEERRRPCRARWSHDFSTDRTLEKLGPKG
jgi:hypothetical protein